MTVLIKKYKLYYAIIIAALVIGCNVIEQSDLRTGDDNTIVSPAIPITGSYLTYNNARIRCDYRDSKTKNIFNVNCITVINQSGNEISAMGISPEVELKWKKPLVSIKNTAELTQCNVAANNLSMSCQIELQSTSAKVDFSIELLKKSTLQSPISESRTEMSTVLFPYYIGIAAGLVPSMPLYQNQIEETEGGKLNLNAARVGFQLSKHANVNLSLEANDMCWHKGALYIVDANQVYKVQDNKGVLYIGSVSGKADDFSHRLKIKLSDDKNAGIFCTDDGIFVADRSNNRVLFAEHEGPVKLVAGTGEAGFDGDGGLAVNAKLKEPFGLYAHPDGSLYITELGNYRIRKVDSKGIISTIAGSGVSGLDNVEGPALAAKFSYPERLVFDFQTDRLIVIDYTNRNIRAIKNGMISNIVTGLNSPSGLLLMDDGNIIYTEVQLHRVRRVDPSGVIHDLAGNGSTPTIIPNSAEDALTASLRLPNSLAYNPINNEIYVSEFPQYIYNTGHDRDNGPKGGRIRAISLGKQEPWKNNKIQLIVGASSDAHQKFRSDKLVNALDVILEQGSATATVNVQGRQRAMAIGPDNLIYFSTTAPSLIRRINADGQAELIFSGDTESNFNGTFISSMDFDKSGRLYFIVRQRDGWVKTIKRVNLDNTGKLSSQSITETLTFEGNNYQNLAIANDGSLILSGQKIFRIFPDLNGAISSNSPITVVAETICPTGDMWQCKIVELKISEQNELYVLVDFGIARENMHLYKTSLNSIETPATLTEVELGNYQLSSFGVLSTGQILGHLYRSNDGIAKLSWLQEDNASPQNMEFIPRSLSNECAGGKVSNSAPSETLGAAFRSSLSVICMGKLINMTVRDNCANNPKGSINIAYTQEFAFQKRNIMQIIRPCTMDLIQ